MTDNKHVPVYLTKDEIKITLDALYFLEEIVNANSPEEDVVVEIKDLIRRFKEEGVR